MSDNRWLTVKEAAASMRMGRTAIYGLVKSGRLTCHRFGLNGGRLLFKQADLDAYAESVRVGPTPAVPVEAKREVYIPKNDMFKARRRNGAR